MTTLEIRLLGGFQIGRAGESVPELPARIQALLANLLLHRNAPCSRQQIAYSFWPESTDKQARANLRQLLHLLHRALPQVDDILEITAQSVAWQPRIPVSLDLEIFEDALYRAPAAGSQRRSALAGAVDVYTGDLLPDCYDEWILPERERLRDAYAQALAELTQLAESERDYPAAIAYARRLLRHDPLHEASYRRLMRLLALTGDRAGALQSYHICATLLHRELGVEPGPETQQLYAQLLHQDSEATAQPERIATGSPNRLVGRVAEWQAMQEQWQQAAPARARWVLISGEAGIGKSRLAEEMLAWAKRQGIPAAQARAYASAGSISYGPLVDLLRNENLAAGWERLADQWLVELARLLPEIQSDLPHLPPPPPLTEEWQKRRLFEALAQALISDGRPHLLVLDDLHWADRESLEFLAFLLRHPAPARLLLVGTARSGEMLDNPTLLTIIREAEAQGHLTQLPLAPLTPAETAELAAQTGGTALDEDAVRALHSDSGGNPLFVEEIVRAKEGYWVTEIGEVSPRPIPNTQYPIPSLPPKIQAVIEERLARLSSSAREIAAQAAVLGRSFTYPVLAAATPLDEVALVDGLDELWRRRIIREVGGEAYDFSHDRIRDVAYGVISAARRRLLHRRAGAALLRVFVGELGPVQGQLGYHFAQAGERLAAIEHYRQAAIVALERYARAEAADYLTVAIDLAESEGIVAVYPLLAERERVNRLARRMTEWQADLAELAQLVEGLDDGSREAIRRQANLILAEHYHRAWTGDSVRALALAQKAAALAQACGDEVIEAEALVGCIQQMWWQGRFDAAQPLLTASYTKALKAGLPNLAADSLALQAQVTFFSGGSVTHTIKIINEALHLYEQTGNQHGIGECLARLLYAPVAQGSGDYRQALGYAERALEIGRRTGSQRTSMIIHRSLVILYTCQGDYRHAHSHMQQAQEAIDQMQEKLSRNVLANYRGFWLLEQGRLTAAKDTQERTLAELRDQKNSLWMIRSITALGWIAFYEGNWREAEERATEAIAESETFHEERQIAHSCTLRGWARLRMNRVDAAIPDFQRSAEILLRLEMTNRAQEPLAGLAEGACLRGDVAGAYAEALPVAVHLLSHPLDRTEDTFLAIHTCHAILRAAGDPLAQEVRALAQAHLRYRASHIEPEHLETFWAMPGHKEMLADEVTTA